MLEGRKLVVIGGEVNPIFLENILILVFFASLSIHVRVIHPCVILDGSGIHIPSLKLVVQHLLLSLVLDVWGLKLNLISLPIVWLFEVEITIIGGLVIGISAITTAEGFSLC